MDKQKKKKQKEKEEEEKLNKSDDNSIDEMNEQDMVKMAVSAGLTKDVNANEQTDELYKGISCEKAFYVFSKENPVRLVFYKLSLHTYFERLILTLIILSSMKLAYDTYILDLPEDSSQRQTSNYLDYVFNISFALETVIKTVSLGLVLDHGSYLRESWNVLDFSIVVSSMVDMAVTGVDLPVIKVLRLLRTLRPLRFISHNIAMKTVVIALLESVGHIFNVVIVVLIVWLMFAILGVSLYQGKMFRCSVSPYEASNQAECLRLGGTWASTDSNFDSVP